jgi:hypothetical protein
MSGEDQLNEPKMENSDPAGDQPEASVAQNDAASSEPAGQEGQEPAEEKQDAALPEAEEKGEEGGEPQKESAPAAANGDDLPQPPPISASSNALATLAAEAVKAGPAPTDGEDQNVIHVSIKS